MYVHDYRNCTVNFEQVIHIHAVAHEHVLMFIGIHRD